MLENVATIVAGKPGGLDSAVEKRAAQGLKELGVERVEFGVLDPGAAMDVFFSGDSAELRGRALDKLQALGAFDVFVQPNDSFRRKKLLLADMDATMVEGETLDEMAAHFGLKDKIAPITARAMRGEIDFAEALRLRVMLLKGMPEELLLKTLEKVSYSAGGASLIRTLGRFGVKCILISGGFDIFTAEVAGKLGFHENFGNRLGLHDQKLTGEVLPPIVDKNFKKRTLEEIRGKMGLDPRLTMAVGDGANDIPMLQAAGAGVGYFAKPAVQAATPHQIRHSDLTALLFMQGYKRAEFAA